MKFSRCAVDLAVRRAEQVRRKLFSRAHDFQRSRMARVVVQGNSGRQTRLRRGNGVANWICERHWPRKTRRNLEKIIAVIIIIIIIIIISGVFSWISVRNGRVVSILGLLGMILFGLLRGSDFHAIVIIVVINLIWEISGPSRRAYFMFCPSIVWRCVSVALIMLSSFSKETKPKPLPERSETSKIFPNFEKYCLIDSCLMGDRIPLKKILKLFS